MNNKKILLKRKQKDYIKKFIVIFENLEPVHLGKDVGMLPKALQNNTNWDVSIFSTLKEFNDTEFEKSVKLKFFTFFKNCKLNKFFMMINLILHVRNIDYLMVFHGDRDKLILFWILKLINPSLVTYVKLDMDEPTAHNIKNHLNIINPFKLRVKKFLSKSVDLYTIETKKVFEIIREMEFYRNKLYLLPNGFYMDLPYDFSKTKEKIMITVGRIGTPQKNNELLLSAISKVDNLRDYKFYFIGTIEVSFQKKIDDLLNIREDLKEKIILTGNISEKDKLFEFYKRAEVFCLSSIYESFALVLTEALYHGCYLLSTDVGAAFDLTDNGKFASIVNVNENLFDELHNNGVYDVVKYINNDFELLQDTNWFENSSKLLADNLQLIINQDIDTQTNSRYVAENVYKNFNWNLIIEDLLILIEKTAGKRKND